MERTHLFFAVDRQLVTVIQALQCEEAQVLVQLGLRLLLYRPLQIQCYSFEVGCVATAHVLLLAYVNVNLHGKRESNIGWPACGSLRIPAGQLAYI